MDSQLCKLSKQRPDFEVPCLPRRLRLLCQRSVLVCFFNPGFYIIISKAAGLIGTTDPDSPDSRAKDYLKSSRAKYPSLEMRQWP